MAPVPLLGFSVPTSIKAQLPQVGGIHQGATAIGGVSATGGGGISRAATAIDATGSSHHLLLLFA
jgi:hypothetical protein